MKKKILLFALAPLFQCIAEDDIYSACTKEAGTMNNAVVSMCSETASEEYKKRINKYYKIIYRGLKEQDAEHADKFEQSQKGWLQYRNNYCELAGHYVGSPMYDYCPMLINETRSKELEEMAQGFQN